MINDIYEKSIRLNKSKKIESKELEKYKPSEIKILYYQIPLFNSYKI